VVTAREGELPARHAAVAAAFLACAIMLGGGGSPNPATELLLQLVFAIAALAWLWLPLPAPGTWPRSRSAWLVCALVLAVPLAQLVPLPPALWTGLGGQQDRAAALALIGRADGWQPLSQAPSRTLAALLAMIPALFAFVAAAALDARGRQWVMGAIAAMALLTVLLGALQLSLGPGAPYLYAENHRGVVTGFQANRNAAADVLLIGMAAAAAFLVPSLGAKGFPAVSGRVIVSDRRAAGVVLTGWVAVLLVGTVLTASRTGIALVPLALLGVCAIVRPALRDLGRLRLLPIAAAAAAMLLIGLGMAVGNTALGEVADRFAFSGDFRRELWRDGWYATERAWPWGIGLGGAQYALIAAERLEILDPALPNRVHNDYLELALEAGLAGLAALAAVAALLVRLAWRAWGERPQDRHLIACGATALLVVALHSLVDYPLRSMALSCLVGAGAGMLVPAGRRIAPPGAAAGGSRATMGEGT